MHQRKVCLILADSIADLPELLSISNFNDDLVTDDR